MSTTTTNLDLIKPALTDPADITMLNSNWDKIDKHILDKEIKFLTSSDDLNLITTPGFYTWMNETESSPANAPVAEISTASNLTNLYVRPIANGCVQEVTANASNGRGWRVQRIIHHYGITPWESINPPLLKNIEYRTTERYNQEAVYVKLLSNGIIYKRTESGLDITPITYGTVDLTAASPLPTGQLYFVYE